MLRALVFLILTAVSTTAAFAQSATTWDRRISDIHIVHPPGTPPGTYRVTAGVGLGADGATPGTMSFDCSLYLNGTLIGVATNPVNPSNNLSVCPGACGIPCTVFDIFSNPVYGFCDGNVPVSCLYCGARVFVDIGTIAGLVATDLLRVTVSPTVGSLPDLDTTNDSMSITVGEQAPGVEYCFGEAGVATVCPCANFGTTGNGCANSVNAAGANLIATGNGSVGSDSVVLTGSGMPNSVVLYYQGTAQVAGGAGSVFGDGKRCVGGSVIRLGVKTNVAGTSQFPMGTDPLISVRGAIPLVGGTRTYQGWYRNSAAFCTASTFNLTNGVSIAWQP